MKSVKFVGSSREDLKSFPSEAMQRCGKALQSIQYGTTPAGVKPFAGVKGCWEVRVSADDSWFRVAYILPAGDYLYVLHAFNKKSNKTSNQDVATIKKRYAEAIADAKLDTRAGQK